MKMIKLYNTLTRKKDIFKPIKEKKVNMFVCGPTVYDNSHIGHARIYVQFDILARFLILSGYKVFYLQNITDIDDKIINKAKEEKRDWKDVKKQYEESYKDDMKKLNVISVNKYADASDYIKEIISQVKRLIKKGYAYKVSDGWYFDLSKDKDYGKLARRTALEAEDSISRIDENKEKKNKGDFCLWKFSKLGEPVWKTDIGDGRPGWHIEDTAITEKEFGVQYDIHGAAIDLIFPHHEAEIAQMESISGKKPMVRYWMHAGFLIINNEKMSKSKGNFYTIKDIFEEGYPPLALRYLFLTTHYKKPLNFSFDVLDYAAKSYGRLKNIMSELRSKANWSKKNKNNLELAKKQFIEIINDDLNAPKALSYLWDVLRDDRLNDAEKYELALDFDRFFGLELDKEEKSRIIKASPLSLKLNAQEIIIKVIGDISEDIIRLAKNRQELRLQKKFKEADEIRNKINKLGYVLEDTENGAIVKEK